MSTALVAAPVLPPVSFRTLHCSGCGRHLLRYDGLVAETVITVRCRDCKTPNTLRGADVIALLGALSQEGVTR
jgi:phage FluMu protein Com